MKAPADPRPLLSSVTVCAVDCVTPGLAASALARSQAQCRFARAVLLADTEVQTDADFIRIEPLRSIQAYSRFMLQRLADYIDTEHVLVVQWDGFVVDAGMWDPAFLDYDYIGAIWPQTPAGREVGNGGFSLRSRRLLEASRQPGFDSRPDEPEDVLLCRDNRDWLERRGIRFAPASLARRFSYEYIAPTQPTFGFHGLFNLWRHLDEAALLAVVRGIPPHLRMRIDFLDVVLRYLGARRMDAAAELFRALTAEPDDEKAMELFKERVKEEETARQLLQLCKSLATLSTPGF